MVATRNHKYTYSSSNNYVIMIVPNLKKKFLIENTAFFSFLRHEVPNLSKQQPQSGCCLR